jgi:RNA polymerase sigma factor (sigma-70 family)
MRSNRVGVSVKRAESECEDLLLLYLADVGRYPLLTKADEIRLAQQIEQGRTAQAVLRCAPLPAFTAQRVRWLCRRGDRAHERFVQSNLRLVVAIARQYRVANLHLLDAIQEGNVGLLRAVDKFDWRKGFKFSTYASWWIRQAITRDAAISARTIRLPADAHDCLRCVQRARTDLESTLRRPPTIGELAVAVDVPEHIICAMLRFATEPRSLAEPRSQDSEQELADLLADDTAESPCDAALAALLPGEIEKLLTSLTTRERQILRLRYGLDDGEARTLQQIGEHLNLTRERIRQIEARALASLRATPHHADTQH